MVIASINKKKTIKEKTLFSVGVASIFILPTLLLRLFTSLYPLIYTTIISFTNYKVIGGNKWNFIGFYNYIGMFKDASFIETLSFTFIFTICTTALQIVISLCVALLLNMKFKGRSILRSIIILPWALAPVAVGTLAKSALDNNIGFINDLLNRFFGISINWLSNIWSSRTAVIGADVWRNMGFLTLIFLAALQSIDNEMYDAAKIDGAKTIQILYKITLPLIKLQILLLSIITFLFSVLTFDIIYVITSGGPGSATSVASYKVYSTFFKNLNFGYAASQAIFLFLIIVIIGGLAMIYYRKVQKQY